MGVDLLIDIEVFPFVLWSDIQSLFMFASMLFIQFTCMFRSWFYLASELFK